MSHAMPPTALLKSGSKGRPHGGLKWDENNLEENEKIKAELPQVKITEPKTPYHATLPGDASGLDPLNLDLDSPCAGQHHHTKDDFEAARKKHYMQEALAASRALIQKEEEEENLKEGKGKK
mmetsp:Transcript_21394/g.36481  ORF Transcript_21394/g.36481 Transcript_21394/m.36481 type:complete len:122 (+) Transcript_21394:132-497(+)